MAEPTWMWKLRTALDNTRFSSGPSLASATVVVDAMSLAACLAHIEEQFATLQEMNDRLDDACSEIERLMGVGACRNT